MQKMQRTSSTDGASLAGVLMIVVILGALTAVGIMSVSSLSGTGVDLGTGNSAPPAGRASIITTTSSAGIGAAIRNTDLASCAATADAARSASSLYYASNAAGSYPVKWSDLTTSNPPLVALPTNVVINAHAPKELDGSGWKLIMAGGGATGPIFTCGPATLRPASTSHG